MNNKVYLLYRCKDYDQMVLGVYSTHEQAVAQGNRTISHWGLKRFGSQKWDRQDNGVVWVKAPENRMPDDTYFLIVCNTIDEKVSL
jgi:hypothetical protein